MKSYFNKSPGRAVAPTGSFDTNGHHLKNEEAPNLETSKIESSTDTPLVWLFGNWWGESEPK